MLGLSSQSSLRSELEGLFKVIGFSCPLVASSIAYYPPASVCMSRDGELTASCDVSLHRRVGLMAGVVFQKSSPNWSLWGAPLPFVLVQLMGSHSPGQLPLPQHFLQHLTAVNGNSPTGLTSLGRASHSVPTGLS